MQVFAGGGGGGGAPDFAQLQSTMQAFEQACHAIQLHMNLAAAEATIVALRQSPHPYQTCRFILENSQMPIARFQVAGVIRDAALREWGHLTIEDKRSLIIFCLQFVMEHAAATDSYVESKVSAVAAQLLKRGWMEFTSAEKEAIFNEVKNAALGAHGLDPQFAGLHFLESLVSEFSPSSSSAMGLPSEFHDQCSSLFEVDCLKNFYCWAQDAALRVTDRVVNYSASVLEDKVCTAALRLMFQILNWDFKHSDGSKNSKTRRDTVSLKKYDQTIVQPGSAWRDVLITSQHIVWLLGLYGTLRKRFSSDVLWFDSPLAVSCRQLIVQFCSLAGTIFPSDNEGSQEKHLLQILDSIVPWIYPSDAVITAIKCGQSESEMLDGCHVLLSIATLTNTAMFENLLKSVRPFSTIHLLSMLTCEVLKDFASCKDGEETWCSEAMDILFETWSVLVGNVNSDSDSLSPEGIGACATLFSLIVDSQLKVAADSVSDDDDVNDHFHASISSRDDKLSSYALIARAAADVTLPLLTRRILDRYSLLEQGKGTSDPTCTLEELYWLFLISGHVITDSGQGETLLVPEVLQDHFLGVVEAIQHPVVALSWSIINFAERSLDPAVRAVFFSPRLMEAVVWFLARWADTYLMPAEHVDQQHNNLSCRSEKSQGSQLSRQILYTFAGENNDGKTLLDTLVRISSNTLISYPGETHLQTLTCCALLPAVVRRKNVCVHLVSLDSWCSLANAFANERTFLSLASRLQRFLAETLFRSASAFQDSTSCSQYIMNLMGPMTKYLRDVCDKDDVKVVFQQPDTIFLVSCLLERLRGAAKATEPRTQKAIFDMVVGVMDPLLVLMDVYKDEAAMVYMILKFAVDLVDGQVVFLNPTDTATLIGFCMRLLQIYSSHNIRKISLSLSTGLLNETKTEKYKDLRALLQLLTNLCSKDLVDFSSTPEGEGGNDIAQVVYLGLHIVIPLMSLELLKYPKLCYQYFALLSHLLEVYPEKVAHLNAEAFGHIVGTLDWGIRHQDIEVVDMCLRAVEALASYHYKETSECKEGLGVHASGFQATNKKSLEGILGHFLRLLMQFILFGNFCMNLVGAAADALLPLLLCEREVYQRLVHELMDSQATEVQKSRLANAFQSLTSSNQLNTSLDRVNRQRFRKNFHKFLIDISGFLRTK